MFQRYKNRKSVFIIYFISLKSLINNYFQSKKVNNNNDNNISRENS